MIITRKNFDSDQAYQQWSDLQDKIEDLQEQIFLEELNQPKDYTPFFDLFQKYVSISWRNTRRKVSISWVINMAHNDMVAGRIDSDTYCAIFDMANDANWIASCFEQGCSFAIEE